MNNVLPGQPPRATSLPAPPNRKPQDQEAPDEVRQSENRDGGEDPDDSEDLGDDSSTDSTDSLEGSPTFVRQNDAYHFLPPTRGERDVVVQDFEQPWKYAGIIYQHLIGQNNARHHTLAVGPRISHVLHVLLGEDETIIDRIAVKCVDVTDRRYLEKAKIEVVISTGLASTRCDHILGYHGTGTRSRTYQIQTLNNGRPIDRYWVSI